MPRGASLYDQARLHGRLWTPEQLRGGKLQAWHSARRSRMTDTGGGLMSPVYDLSGKGNDWVAVGGVDKPQWKATGLSYLPHGFAAPAFDTDKSNDCYGYTNSIAYAGASGLSAFAAFINDGGNAATKSIFCGATGSPEFRLHSGKQLKVIRTFQADLWTTTMTVPGGPCVLGWDVATNFMRAWINGQPEETTTNGAFTQPITVFGRNGVDGTQGIYPFVEALICVPILTAREAELVQGYLAWEWNWQSSLHASSKFRNRPPLIGD